MFSLCIIQHRNRPLRSTALNAHGTNASPDGLCGRTHADEASSCWFCCKSFRVDGARRSNVCFERHSWAVFQISKAWNVRTRYQYTITVLSCCGKHSAERGFSQLWADRMCTMWAVSLRHAASDTTAVRPALLMGGRGGSAVDIVVVVRGTSSSLGRVG